MHLSVQFCIIICIYLLTFPFHVKGTAVSQSKLPNSANDVDKNRTVTNHASANQRTASDEHGPITRNTSFGSEHETPSVTPRAHVKPRMV